MYSFISIRCRLALYSLGVLFIFFYMVFWVNQKVYAEDVPWTSVSNEGERVLFQEQSLYSNDLRGEDLVSPSFEGRKNGREDWGYLLENTKLNYSPNILTYSVIGIDDRIRVNDTTSYPYSAIVHVATQYNNGEIYGCTGALINKDTVLTAGHCIYNKEIGGWATNVIVTPCRNGGQAPYLPFKGTKPITFYVQNKEKQPIKDFEIMLIKDESPGPSKEIVISIGKTNQEGTFIWKTPRKGKYIILLPNNEKKAIVINDRNVAELITINVN